VAGAKGVAFVIPLFLAGFLEPQVYGSIEFAWSTATILASVIAAGIPAALPQLVLLRRTVHLEDILAGSVAVLGAGALLIVGVASVFHGPVIGLFISALTVVALAQGNLGAYARTYSFRGSAQWIDGLGFYLVFLVALGVVPFGPVTVGALTTGTSLVAGLITLLAAALAAKTWQPEMWERGKLAVRTGVPMLANSLCSIWSSVCPRVYLGAVLGAQPVAVYSVGFRVAAVTLGVQSVLATGLFVRLYGMRTRQYDRFISAYLLLMAMVCCIMIVAFPYLLNLVSLRAIGADHKPDAVAIFPIVTLHIFAWLTWGWLEFRVSRARRAGRSAFQISLMMIAVLALIGGLNYFGYATLRSVLWSIVVQMIAGVLIQLRVLWKRGIRLRRTAGAFAFGMTAILLLGWKMTA
jgi:O-antigen/teichoic acid export membrane protein